jgi:pyruvate dehydrogenase E2 component (dihydrolipoamide acetyltransferase)
MATNVILPALGMAQETGKIVQWLKSEGDQVAKGDPIAEIETDKATVELESPASGFLANITGQTGEDIPVGQVIATILAQSESRGNAALPGSVESHGNATLPGSVESHGNATLPGSVESSRGVGLPRPLPSEVPHNDTNGYSAASPLAARIANEHNLDLSLVKPGGRRIQKADVLTYLQTQEQVESQPALNLPRLSPASPKARRLAAEQGKNLTEIPGSGPQGAILAADVLNAPALRTNVPAQIPSVISATHGQSESTVSTTWCIMAERTTQSWTGVPHFYLTREVNASRLIVWRTQALKQGTAKITYTDLLVKLVAASLRLHPRLNVSWSEGKIFMQQEVNVGLAVAIEEGLVVPVISAADTLGLAEIAQQRIELVAKAQAGKLRLQDISGGTFTISNLGMYNVDAFNAIINQPQAAILAVGRIADRVVPLHGQPAVRPMMVLTLSCDHRAVDGARGAHFLDSLATLIEEPLGLLG